MGENPSNSGLKSMDFCWECHEKVKKALRRSITFDKSVGVLLQNKTVDKKLYQSIVFSWECHEKNLKNKHCARASHPIKVTECCSKPRMFTESGFESSTMGKTCCAMGKAFYSMGKTFSTSLLTLIQNEMPS